MNTPRLRKFLITPTPEIAAFAEECGVEVIFVDLEVHGKHERQKNQGTPIYAHTPDDIYKVKKVLKRADLLVRVNPLHAGSKEEIDRAVDGGANIIMLPFFHHPDDILPLVERIDGRTQVSLLFETPQSLFRFQHFVDRVRFDEAYFGLNDLRILTGLKFLFETLAGGILEGPIRALQDKQIPFGIGGIGVSGHSLVNPKAILGEYARLGASRVILSRAFVGGAKTLSDLKKAVDLEREVALVNAQYAQALERLPAQVLADQAQFRQLIYETAKGMP